MRIPKVSVIINCLNGEKYLRQALDSVFKQTYTDWEIVFWDNGSTDSSGKIAKSYGDRVRYFYSAKTVSLGNARNLCMAQARGEYLSFLDCDDIWLSRKLEKQIPLFEKDEDVALVFTDAIYFNDKGDICQLYKKYKPSRGKIFKELFRKYYLCMPSIVIRKSAIEGTSWFDERMKFFEDGLFFLRLAYKHKADYFDEPLVRYRVHSDSSTIKEWGSLADEKDLGLKALISEFPGFEIEYEQEIEKYKSKTNAQRAVTEWINGNPVKSRQILINKCHKNFLFYTLFLITFLPSSTFKTLVFLNFKVKGWFNWYKFEHPE